MGLYINRIVIDANVINSRGNIPAMNELESFFNLSIIEILKTSVLELEFDRFGPGTEKAKTYTTIHGSSFLGWVPMVPWVGRKSNFEMIYNVLWGGMWKKGGPFQNEIEKRSFRDTIHLDTCWINDVDFFITNENAILNKREALYAHDFDTRIVTPEECLKNIKEDFKKDFGTNDATIISKRIKDAHRILLGSNSCVVALIQDKATNETLFQTHWDNGRLHLEANIYDSSGEKIAKIMPNEKAEIMHPDANLSIQHGGPKIFYAIDPSLARQKIEQYLRIGQNPSSIFYISKNKEIFLSGRIVPSGHVVFEGTFYNKNGEFVAAIKKKTLKYFGTNYNNCTANILPPQTFPQ